MPAYEKSNDVTPSEPSASGAEPGQHRMGRKELLALISSIMAFTAMGIDLMLSAFDEIRTDFDLGATSTETSRIVTVYLLGLAVGQLFYGPLADRFGRKKALVAGAAVYVVGAAGAALATSFGMLLGVRFVWGLGAAGARVVATAIIRDRFEGAAMASALSNVMAVFVLVPIVAPSLGAGIIAVLPWRSVFWFCAIFAAVIVLWSLRMRETLDPSNRRELRPKVIADGYLEVARTPVTFGFTMATLFIQGSFVTYLASSELIISNIFDREAQFPVVFGAIAIMFGVASFINGRIVERLGIDTVVNRAYLTSAISLVLLVGLTIFSTGTPNFWLFMPLVGLILATFMFLMTNLSSAAMVPLGAIAGSGSALTGAVRTAGGAFIGGIISEQIATSVTPLVIGLCVLVACSAGTVWLTRQGGLRSLLARRSQHA
jgi:DHA1 family bicyclomycin/chloramphenicol resistance-like MFS transporter